MQLHVINVAGVSQNRTLVFLSMSIPRYLVRYFLLYTSLNNMYNGALNRQECSLFTITIIKINKL